MSLTAKYWLAFSIMIVSGIGVIQLYAPVFNGIEPPDGITITLFIVSVVILSASAMSYYYLRAARKYQTASNDLTILEKISLEKPAVKSGLTKNK